MVAPTCDLDIGKVYSSDREDKNNSLISQKLQLPRTNRDIRGFSEAGSTGFISKEGTSLDTLGMQETRLHVEDSVVIRIACRL